MISLPPNLTSPGPLPALFVPVPELPALPRPDAEPAGPAADPPVPGRPEDAAGLTFAFHTVEGETLAYAYTSLDRLVEACGIAQPWVTVALDDLIYAIREAGATLLLVDSDTSGETMGVDVADAVEVLDERRRRLR